MHVMEVIQLMMPYNQIHPVAVYIVFVYVIVVTHQEREEKRHNYRQRDNKVGRGMTRGDAAQTNKW